MTKTETLLAGWVLLLVLVAVLAMLIAHRRP